MSGDCRVCGVMAYMSDDQSPVHPCCLFWARLAPGRGCVACGESSYYRRNNAWRGKSKKKAKV